MKKNQVRINLFITAILLFPGSGNAFWQTPWAPRSTPTGYSFEGFTQNFFSDSNYTAGGGEFIGLPQNGNYFASRNRFMGAYTLKSGIQLRSSLDLSMAGIKNDVRDESSMTLSGWNFGLVYPFLKNGPYSLTWELSGHLSLDTLEAGRTEPLGHDGVHFVQTHMRLLRTFGLLGLFTQHGLYFPTEGLAGLWYWNLGAEYQFQQLILSAQLEGYSTVIDDTYTDQPSQRANVLGAANGGSFAFHTVNPQRLDLRAIAEFQLTERWTLPVSLLRTLNGQHSAAGFELAAGLRWQARAPGAKKALRKEDFKVDRPQRKQKEEIKYGEDGEPLKDAERLMEDRFKKRK